VKRFHIHVGVEKLDESIRFYSALFGAKPVKTKPDYAKWMIDDPRVNFAISTRASQKGVDHLGIQVEENGELDELRERLKAADMAVFDEGETVCCYAQSDKSWIQDPTGLPWEAYRTMEDAQLFSGKAETHDGACCTPETMGVPDRCEPSNTTTECCGG
jgi:catechol 2,3-dioxygenase-like lactoylglutathione lyase family enzyme